MKTTIPIQITSRPGKICLFALVVCMAFSCSVKAQSDNFDDGNDTANPTWSHYDPIGDFIGIPNGSWTFPGSNTYRLQADASPDPGVGPGRIASTLTNVYSDFYTTVDVVDWDDTLDQAFGILARLENVGLGTTTGYVFTYQELDHTVSISRIANEVATDLTGTSTSITLFRTNHYRFVFTGQGTNFVGWIYQLPDISAPIVVVSGSDSTYSNGIGGLLVFDNSSGGGGIADATYDNYFAATHEPPPVITSIHNIANNGTVAHTIGVRFDRTLNMSSATNLANYVVNAGTVNVTDVHLRPDGRSVEVIAGSAVGDFFSVCATNVQSLGYSSAPTIGTGYTSEYSGTTIGTFGDPSADGQVYTSFWDTFDIIVDGSDIGGTNDHFHFIHQAYGADFDARVLVTQLDFASDFSKAGLMARESLAPDSANVFTCFTPVLGANEIQDTIRPVASDDTTNFMLVPTAPADPLRWLRLTRVGDVFTAFYGTNGEDWVVSGSVTQALSKTLHVGLAATSQTNSATTTASFTDFLVRGPRPGDDIVPTLSVFHTGQNVVLKWPRTPRSYALQVSTNLVEWGLLVIPILLADSNSAFQTTLPIGLLGSSLFLRPERVDKLIPDIASIMVTTGIILSPGSGLLTNSTSGALCSGSGPAIAAGTAFAQTGSYVVFANPLSPTASIDTLQSSTGVNTGLQVRNSLNGMMLCNDDAAIGVKFSKQTLPGVTSALYTKYTFVAGAISPPVSPTATIKVWLNY
jgi:regulation of enolase protein 1 (concanavalin A-like superfamily)